MTNRFSFLFILQFLVTTAFSQEINRQGADSMIKALDKTKQGIDRITLVLNLAEFHMFKPGEFKNDLDSAAGLIGQARQMNAVLKSREGEGHILLEESYLANEYKDRGKGKQLLEEAIRILEKEKNYYLLGRAYKSLGDYFDINNSTEVPNRMDAFKRAIAAFSKGGNIVLEADTYGMLAETDSSDATTEQELNNSLALYNSIHYQQLQRIYDQFAQLYIIRSNFPEALQWALKALKTAETVGDSTMQICAINNHIAIIYDLSHDSASAIKYFSAALRTAERYNDKSTIYLLTHNIALIYFNRQQPIPARDLLQHIQKKYGPPDRQAAVTYFRFIGDVLKVHTLLKQFQLAEPYCRQLIDAEKESQLANFELSEVYVNILDYFLASAQYTRMLPYLKKDDLVTKSFENPRNKIKLHQLWFCYDTSQHNNQSAVDHLLQYNILYETINNQARDRSLKELQVQFDTKRKEDEITLLNKETQLEKANLRQATLAKNMTIAGIIAVLIIAGLLYRQNRVKQRNSNVITHKNEQLQHLLIEKDWLLKEIHHRVKNNLQIVMSLLNSQSVYVENESALTAIHDSQHRVQAMSLIHQKLYNSENLSSIDMSYYVRELVSYLADSFNTGQRIRFVFDTEPLELDVSQAVPLGLILNEAITNAIKYAFPDGRNGEISISLVNTASRHFLLSISDNGIGIPPHFKNKKSGSLGMSLMSGLSEDLDGHFSIENKNGTVIKISFVHDLAVRRPDAIAESVV